MATYLSGLASPTVYDIGGAAGVAYPSGTLLAGGDRFATSALVAEKFFASPTVVGVATGANFPDALAGAGAMGIKGGPVLLSDPFILPSADALYLTNQGATITGAFLFGGIVSLSPAIATTVSNQIRLADSQAEQRDPRRGRGSRSAVRTPRAGPSRGPRRAMCPGRRCTPW